MALPPWLRYQIKLYIFIAHCCIVFLLSAHSRSWQQSHGTTSATTTTTILVSTRTSRHLCGRRKLAAKVIHKLLSTQVHMCVCICVLVRCSSAAGRCQDATMPGCSKTLLFVYAPLFILYFLLLLHCCHFHCMLYICMYICVSVCVCVCCLKAANRLKASALATFCNCYGCCSFESKFVYLRRCVQLSTSLSLQKYIHAYTYIYIRVF